MLKGRSPESFLDAIERHSPAVPNQAIGVALVVTRGRVGAPGRLSGDMPVDAHHVVRRCGARGAQPRGGSRRRRRAGSEQLQRLRHDREPQARCPRARARSSCTAAPSMSRRAARTSTRAAGRRRRRRCVEACARRPAGTRDGLAAPTSARSSASRAGTSSCPRARGSVSSCSGCTCAPGTRPSAPRARARTRAARRAGVRRRVWMNVMRSPLSRGCADRLVLDGPSRRTAPERVVSGVRSTRSGHAATAQRRRPGMNGSSRRPGSATKAASRRLASSARSDFV